MLQGKQSRSPCDPIAPFVRCLFALLQHGMIEEPKMDAVYGIVTGLIIQPGGTIFSMRSKNPIVTHRL